MRRLMQRFLPAQEPPASLDQRILAAAQRAAEQRQSQKRPLPSEKKGWLAWLESFLLAPSVRPLLAFCMLALVVGTSYFLQKDEPWFQAQKTGTPNSGIDLLRDIPLGQARSTDKQKSQKKQAIGSLSQKKPARRAPRTRSAAPRSGLTRSVAPRSAPKQDTRLRDKRESPNEGAKANREKAILDNVAREKARRQELRTRRLRRRRKRKRKNAKVSPRRRSRTLFKGRRQKSLRPPLPRSTRKAPPPKGYSFGTRGDIIQKDPEKPKPRQPAGWTSPRRAPQSMTKAPKPAARPSAPAARPAPAPLARQTKGAGAGGRSGFAIGGANAPAAPAPSDDDFAPKKQSSGGFAVPPPPARKRQDEPTLRFAKPSVPPPPPRATAPSAPFAAPRGRGRRRYSNSVPRQKTSPSISQQVERDITRYKRSLVSLNGPQKAIYYRALGVSLLRLGRLREAKRYFKAYLQALSPTQRPAAQRSLNALMQRHRKHQQTLRMLRRLQKTNPSRAGSYQREINRLQANHPYR